MKALIHWGSGDYHDSRRGKIYCIRVRAMHEIAKALGCIMEEK